MYRASECWNVGRSAIRRYARLCLRTATATADTMLEAYNAKRERSACHAPRSSAQEDTNGHVRPK